MVKSKDYKSAGYQSPFGALLHGIAEGSDENAKNRFKRDAKEEDRRFQVAKMMASKMLENQYQRQNSEYKEMAEDRKDDQKLSEEFPEQWQPIRSVAPMDGNNFLPREELARVNQVYEAIRQERVRRRKLKEEGAMAGIFGTGQ